MQFTFAQVERALALTNNISDERRSAFSHRLKHLQRLKFPPGVNTGRGRAATYTVGHLYLLGTALELNQLGLTPERAVRIIRDNLIELWVGAGVVGQEGPPKGSFEFPVVLYFDPAALRDLAKHSDEPPASEKLQYGDMMTSIDHLQEWMRGGLSRLAFISLSALVWDLATYSCADAGASHEAFYDELMQWGRNSAIDHAPPLDPSAPF